MPARLVNSPKAYVYTKDQSGATHNFTSYVVSGEVQRLLNQVSTAEVVLRNPQKIFTTPSRGVAFHPMDPITIYLERLPGFPVRVFTGYLDSTPYYQMFPGTITLKASCTLKRLLYTFFDPSLPYVIAFFTKYGWINTGQGSIISSKAFDGQNAASQADVNAGKKPFTTLQDGSLGKLLWAILYDIGEWQDSNIYVENLPSGANGLAARMAALMKSLQADQQQAENDFTTFLNSVIGANSQGSGGGAAGGAGTPSGPVKGAKQIVETVQPIADKYNIPLVMVLATMYIETTFNNQDSAGNPHYGWFQVQTANPPYAYGTWSTHIPTVSEAHDLGLSAVAFCSAAAGWASKNHSLRNNFQQWAMDTQGVTAQNNPRYVTAWPTALGTSLSMIGQFASAGKSSAQSNQATTQQGSTAPSKDTAKLTGVYVNPLAKAHNVRGERIDMGVDYACDPGDPIVALGDCVYDDIDPNFYNGQPALYYKLTSGPLKGLRFYYSEGVQTPSYSIGASFRAGDVVTHTTSQPSGLEFGWADPSVRTPYAKTHGGYVEGQRTDAGKMFDRLMTTLGAPQSSSGNPGTGPVAPNGTLGGQIGTGGAGGGSTGDVSSASTAQAFVAELQFPSVEDQVTAIALGAEHKGLMHDQSLMPFVQQVCQASMRNFQSLPNGDFYAFYPDYFGEMGHHAPYWYIRDIEILNGGINLTDDALATHVFAVGDNTWPVNNELLNKLFSAGTVNIFNAFVGNGIVDNTTKKKTQDSGLAPGIMGADEAVKFIQRYGARPLVQDYPMVRSPIYEMLLAYQQFMLAWSNQFQTPFTFTFMPELFPGGKVGFPDHGIQMYINSVTHSWNYEEGGFTTTADLSAPALLDGVNAADFPDIPPHMVAALIEPLRSTPPGHAGGPSKPPTNPQFLQKTATNIDNTVNNVVNSLVGFS